MIIVVSEIIILGVIIYYYFKKSYHLNSAFKILIYNNHDFITQIISVIQYTMNKAETTRRQRRIYDEEGRQSKWVSLPQASLA